MMTTTAFDPWFHLTWAEEFEDVLWSGEGFLAAPYGKPCVACRLCNLHARRTEQRPAVLLACSRFDAGGLSLDYTMSL